MTISARLSKLEAQVPAPETQGRVIRIVARQEDYDAAIQLAESEGYDTSEDGKDIVVIRLIAVQPGQPGEYRAPYFGRRD